MIFLLYISLIIIIVLNQCYCYSLNVIKNNIDRNNRYYCKIDDRNDNNNNNDNDNSNNPKTLRDILINNSNNVINKVLKTISISIASSSLVTSSSTLSYASEGSINGILLPRPSKRLHLYSVEMSDPPCLLPRTKVGELSAIKKLAANDIIIFGEHLNSKQDNELESSILTIMNDECRQIGKQIVLGLEMIEKDSIYQTALDTYITNQKLSLEEADKILLDALNWKNLLYGEYNTYLPLLHFARKNKIRLIALGIALSLQKKILENGLDTLTDIDRSRYVPDPIGFLDTVRKPGFQRYADKVISASYKSDIENGFIPSNTNLDNYFGNRILVDEGIASTSANFVNDNPQTTFIIISKKERVIFGYGIQERAQRYLSLLKSSKKIEINEEKGNDVKISSILLNPTANDSLSYTSQLQLSLGYGQFLKDQMPLANFIWFTNDPMVKLLTRPKNPISKEGDKPAGESSILKAF